MAIRPSMTMGFRWFCTICFFDGLDEAGFGEVLRHVHPRRALPLHLFAALIDDAGVEHGLRDLLPELRFDLADEFPHLRRDRQAHGILRDELADVGKLDLSLRQFHVVRGFLPGELHQPQHANAEDLRDPVAQEALGDVRVRGGSIARAAVLRRDRRHPWRNGRLRGRGCRRAVRPGKRRRFPPVRPARRPGDGPLEVVHPGARLLRVLAAVVDDEVDDPLLRQPGVDAEVRERQVVPALALVLQVVALAVARCS